MISRGAPTSDAAAVEAGSAPHLVLGTPMASPTAAEAAGWSTSVGVISAALGAVGAATSYRRSRTQARSKVEQAGLSANKVAVGKGGFIGSTYDDLTVIS